MVNKSQLIKKIFHAALLFVVFACYVFPTNTNASSYQVNASIPYVAPSQAATINGSPDGTTVANALQTISGSCQVQNPADVVSVWRGGTSIGSTPCNSGTYTLQIMLIPGDNILIVRTANASLLYGPDATPITITLVLPPTPPADPNPTPAAPSPTPPSPAATQNQTPEQIIESTNAGAMTELAAQTTEPFSVLSTNNDVTVQVTISGGQKPYTINLDWGDGSTESHSVAVAGVYSFTHAYEKDGSYMVRGNVHDVLGASTQFSYAVISSNPKPGNNASGSTYVGGNIGNTNPIGTFLRKHWKPIVTAVAALTLAETTYVLGKRRRYADYVAYRRTHTSRAKKIGKHR
ncbi:hypothetical protein H7097_04450 [Aeromicrobium sp.]|nr:hypothetical protein [Candidatus Saccharibacteria bacterium]